jgi:hypothetical protein
LRARFYNPETGRLLSTDPLSGRVNDPRTFQLYVYGFSDPANHSDPSGKFSLFELSTATVIAGVLAATATVVTAGYLHFELGLNPVASVAIGAFVGAVVYVTAGGALLALAPGAPQEEELLESPGTQRLLTATNQAIDKVGEGVTRTFQVITRQESGIQRLTSNTQSAMDTVRNVVNNLGRPLTPAEINEMINVTKFQIQQTTDPDKLVQLRITQEYLFQRLRTGQDPGIRFFGILN